MPGTTFDGIERSLLDFRVVVRGLAIEREDTDVDKRIVGMRPDLGEIERVVLEVVDLAFGHDLDLTRQDGKVSLLDGVEKITLRVVGVGAGEGVCISHREVLDALIGLEVPLAIDELVPCR